MRLIFCKAVRSVECGMWLGLAGIHFLKVSRLRIVFYPAKVESKSYNRLVHEPRSMHFVEIHLVATTLLALHGRFIARLLGMRFVIKGLSPTSRSSRSALPG